MAQHDFVINNQGFPAFRSDLNDFLNAVRTTHSGTSLPSGAVAGTIWLDTTSATIPLLKYYDGTDNILLATINHSTNTVTFSGVATDLVNDLTPQLGGDLDVQTNKVVSTSNLNVKVYPNGTGVFEVGGSTNSGRIQLNCEQNTHGIKLASPPHSAGQNYTLTFPSTAPSAGKVLQTDGSGNLSFESVSGGISWQSSVKTSGFTATAGEGYFCNTTSAGFTVTLPATPTAGQQVAVVDYAGTFDTNALVISPNGGKIEGGTDNLKLTGEREGVLLVYIDSTQGWIATSGINEGTDALESLNYSVDFLVIAGGGAGGYDQGGGGGAGGYRNSYSTETSGGGGNSEASLTFNPGTVYTITVGAGGAGVNATVSNAGNDSSISGTGITTITSIGGGRGGLYNTPASGASSGGSGGGSAGGSPAGFSGASGTANQGYAGGSATGSASTGTGGGGAGAVGANTSSNTPGAGGNGLASSITGSSTTRAGGGGSMTANAPQVASSGGSGGGGDGTTNTGANGNPGTVNTGSGGGGCWNSGAPYVSGSGGKGVVILRMPTASYSGTTTGSPTVTTDGTDTVIVFNDSGSITG